MPRAGIAIEYVSAVINTMPAMLSQRPARFISNIDTYPDPNTIALGGVATGSMNAQLAATAAGLDDDPLGEPY